MTPQSQTLPAGYFATMTPGFATSRYRFPADAAVHEWLAADGSEWIRGLTYWHRVHPAGRHERRM